MRDPERFADRFMAPMVGRRHEMQVLTDALQEMRTRRKAGAVFLTGEAGVGKTRLVSEFNRLSENEAVTFYSGQCLTNQPVVAYWVFLDVLRSSLGVQVTTPPGEVSRKLTEMIEDLLGDQVMETLPYLEHLLNLPPSDPVMAQKVKFLDPERLQQRIFLAVRNYLEALSFRQPLVIILEDLLEADESSLDLLVYLFEMLVDAPILVIAVSRPFLQGKLKRVRFAAKYHWGESCQNLFLSHLAVQDCDAILNQFLGLNDLPERFRKSIIEQSQGIPFYVEEIVRMLIDLGTLRRSDGQWEVTGTANLERFGIPDSLQSLVRWRFNRLQPDQQRFLQAAAVIGKEFNRSVLLDVLHPLDEEQLEKQVRQLAERGFLLSPQADGEGTLAFQHNLSAEIIYNTLPAPELASLHGCVGEALETFYNRVQIQTQIDLLAHHFSRSDRKEPALHYLTQAGLRASRRYINDQSRLYFEMARDLLGEVPHKPLQAMEVYMGLGDVLLLVGEYQVARFNYDRALKAVADEPELKVLAQNCALNRKLAATYERQGEFEQAIRYLTKARRMVEDRSRAVPAEEAQVLNDMGWINFRFGHSDEAEQDLVHALSLARQVGRHDITASIYNRLGGVYWQKDNLAKATNFVQKSLALREEIGDMVAVARSYNNLGLLDWKLGDWDSALGNFNRCLAMHANFGDAEGIIDVHGNLGLLQLDRGAIMEARTHMEEALSKARKIGHNYIIAMTLMYLSRLHIATESWSRALDYARQSLETFEEMRAEDELVDIYALHGQAYLGLGEIDRSVEWTDKAFDLVPRDDQGEALAQTNEAGRALRLLGELRLVQGKFEQAERWFDRCESCFSGLDNSLELARTRVLQARLASDRDDPIAANSLLEDARQRFEQLGAKLDLQRLGETELEY